jgi:hypothetical protein
MTFPELDFMQGIEGDGDGKPIEGSPVNDTAAVEQSGQGVSGIGRPTEDAVPEKLATDNQ